MRVLVTGATGMLGNNLVRALLAEGHEVRGLVRSKDKASRVLAGLDIELVQGDIRDVPGIAPMFHSMEAVCHTAAYFREYYRIGDHAQALREVNIDATLNLMREADASGVRRFIHVSSGGTVGQKPDGSPGDEDTPPSEAQLRNLYFRSKFEGDKEIRAWQPLNGMAVLEALPGWMWGPWDAAPTGAGRLALDYLDRKLPGILNGGAMVADARDVAAGMVKMLEGPAHGERFCLCGHHHTLEELMLLMEESSGVPAPKLRIPNAVIDMFAFTSEIYGRLTGAEVLITRQGVQTMRNTHQVSSAKAERILGATFRPAQETVRDTLAWITEHRQMVGM
jgi:dihydroflavonol-4-reductase